MKTTTEREMVKKAYPSKKWAVKVDQMTDGQVYAIFLRLKRDRKI